jgi:phage gp29-like protein
MKLYFEAFTKKKETKQLAAGASNDTPKRFLPYEMKAVSRVRQDIKNWNIALDMSRTDEPTNWAMQLLYNEALLDAHLTSQLENRKQQVFSLGFLLKTENGEIDEVQTDFLKNAQFYRQLTNIMLDTKYYGYNLVELALEKTSDKQKLTILQIPRTNITPQNGRFFKDYTNNRDFINYRNLAEFGTWVLEFIPNGIQDANFDLGLLNKAIPHVLFKRFAQSCWSELCEIYGIPPRVMKTNTQDNVMLKRAEQMMSDMGAAAWFIIDETESFEFAQGVSTNGDVYKNLMDVCRNEISLLISGAVIGQDTVNGNRSKEESSQNMLWELVKSDMAMLEDYWNNTIIPALQRIGILKGNIKFEFEQAEDLDQLFKFTTGLLPFKEVDNDWLKEKFGVEVTGNRNSGIDANQLSVDDFFV